MSKKLMIWLTMIYVCTFVVGILVGNIIGSYEAKTYLGAVISKEYIPEEYKENPETKTIEKYEEDYSVKVRDYAGDTVSISVSKEEFNQLDIGEKLKR